MVMSGRGRWGRCMGSLGRGLGLWTGFGGRLGCGRLVIVTCKVPFSIYDTCVECIEKSKETTGKV